MLGVLLLLFLRVENMEFIVRGIYKNLYSMAIYEIRN